MDTDKSAEKAEDLGNTEEVGVWIKELEAARTREKAYREMGQKVLDLYDGTKHEDTPFNILYSNTETVMPALYSATPRPVVERRFKDDDPLGKQAALAGKRMLEYLLDTDTDGYETFDHAMENATLLALLPGRAMTIVKYDAEEQGDEYAHETVCPQSVPWKEVLCGYAKTWEQVPWIAYEMTVDRAEATRILGEEAANLLTYSQQSEDGDKDQKKTEPHQGERKTACIHQIWDKEGGKKIRYLSEQVKDRYLKVTEDPLGLMGFFNCPRPLQFVSKPHTLLPTALYVLYQAQAQELNELTRRIKRITKAIKARGLYDGELGDTLKNLLEADDAELVPTDRGSSLATDKGMDKAIFMWPVDKLIQVLLELYRAREACKQVIYEITGISDILRGSTKASETLGAQEIKTQWGTLRLKNKQKEVARYAVDLLRLMLEIAASKFSEETWAKMTGLPFLLSKTFNELTALVDTLQKELLRRPAPQPPPPPGPPAPPTDPLIAQLQQLQQQLQAPKWADVLALLRNDLHRSYRIDIETNTTVEPEAAEDQKALQEILTALSQVVAQIGPLVVKGVLPFEAAQTLLLTVVRRYRFGAELEDTIMAMKPPPPPDDGAEAAKKQLELEKQQAQMEVQFKQKQAEMAVQEKAMAAEMAAKQREMDLQLREAKLKVEQMLFHEEQVAAQQQAQLREQAAVQKIEMKQKQLQQQHQMRQREMAGSTR